MPGGQIAAQSPSAISNRGWQEIAPNYQPDTGRLRRKRAGYGERSQDKYGNRPAIETNGKHHSSLSSRIYGGILRIVSNANPTGSIITTMPRLALNRKDTGQGYGKTNRLHRP